MTHNCANLEQLVNLEPYFGKMKFLTAICASVATGFCHSPSVQSFDFKDPKGVSGLSISIDSPLEPVRGHANGVSGTILFDPSSPEKSSGKIIVDTATTYLGSKKMSDALQSDWCLDVKKYPTLEFAITRVSGVKEVSEGKWTANVEGDFTLKDVTKPMNVEATVTLLPGKIKQRGGLEGVTGDLLQIHVKFSFNRRDFKLAPDLSSEVIGDQINIDFAAIGVCPTP